MFPEDRIFFSPGLHLPARLDDWFFFKLFTGLSIELSFQAFPPSKKNLRPPCSGRHSELTFFPYGSSVSSPNFSPKCNCFRSCKTSLPS